MSTTSPTPLALSPKQVAERLGGSLRWVNGLLADNTLPSCRVAGRRLIRVVDLENLLVPTPFAESLTDVVTEATRIVAASQSAGALPQ